MTHNAGLISKSLVQIQIRTRMTTQQSPGKDGRKKVSPYATHVSYQMLLFATEKKCAASIFKGGTLSRLRKKHSLVTEGMNTLGKSE